MTAAHPLDRPESPTRQVIRTMRREGRSVRDIAAALGVSTQAVYQAIARMERDDAAASAR
jgi:hypothetical protein